MAWLKLLYKRTISIATMYTGTFIVVMILNQLIFFGFCLNPICLVAAMPHVLLITVVLGSWFNKENDWGKRPDKPAAVRAEPKATPLRERSIKELSKERQANDRAKISRREIPAIKRARKNLQRAEYGGMAKILRFQTFKDAAEWSRQGPNRVFTLSSDGSCYVPKETVSYKKIVGSETAKNSIATSHAITQETVHQSQYRISTLSKGGGKFRTIYIPDPELKLKLRSFLPALQKVAATHDRHKVCHGFMTGRSCVTNAMQHIGYRYTVSLDIQEFFDSVGAAHLAGKVPDEILSSCLIKGAPRQGLPTSPLIANIALTDADSQIVDSLNLMKSRFSYTRYADDITISIDDKKSISRVLFLVRDALAHRGFTVNERKTQIQSATNGRRIVTGIGVDAHNLHATRKTLKNMRAALHQKKTRAARGLLEWALCKQPGQKNVSYQNSIGIR